MKKLIAILVVFAMVAGAAFAAEVGVDVFGKVNVAEGSTGKTAFVFDEKTGTADFESGDPKATGGMGRIQIQASAENEEGTFGGWLRMRSGADGVPANGHGNMWWKPLDVFKLMIGTNGGDGFFGLDGMTRWGFYGAPGADVMGIEGWAFSSSFFGGAPGGAILTLTPMEALEINVNIPYFQKDNLAENVYKSTTAQFKFNIDGVGTVGVTYAGNLNNSARGEIPDLTRLPGLAADLASAQAAFDPDDEDTVAELKEAYEALYGFDYSAKLGGNGSKFYGYFGLSAIENLSVDLGIGYTLAVTDEISKAKYTAPMAVGLGVGFNSDAFGVKLRVQGEFAETYKPKGGDEVKGPMVIIADVLPSFAIDDSFKFYFSAGLKMTMPDEGDNVTGWHVHPYITKSAGAGTFVAGFRAESSGEKDEAGTGGTYINWAIPIGMAFSF